MGQHSCYVRRFIQVRSCGPVVISEYERSDPRPLGGKYFDPDQIEMTGPEFSQVMRKDHTIYNRLFDIWLEEIIHRALKQSLPEAQLKLL